MSWDEELPPDIKKRGVNGFPRSLVFPNYIFLDMCSVLLRENPPTSWNFTVCDASQKAYGVVIYTRVMKDCNVEVNLLVSKSRVAPLTKIILPRLELLGALLAARLASKVKAIVDLKRPSKVLFWTD
ncbi:hypothetical protein AVEN_187628-1 [Araneus ventricosus]|uniref:Reverse transcriptase/retrotransposon-derived protein RNase H-like domain-containing protein n=1 Tax=Araneus ventricosus TaxID=182803 RepID=A0A4Y2MWU5_ARAVE|nr:hypothetical protein AVEN_187628-1 [Araneus ventricosus]